MAQDTTLVLITPVHGSSPVSLKDLKPGDSVVIKEINRRNDVVDEGVKRTVPKKKRAKPVSIEASLSFVDIPALHEADVQDGVVILDIVQHVVSFMKQTERKRVRKRQSDAIAAAKARGVQIGRRPKEIPELFNATYEQWRNGEITATKAAKTLNVDRNTFQSWVKKADAAKG